MGKATITNHIANGQYNVTINFDRSRTDAEIVRLNAENIAIDTRLTELDTEIASAALAVDYASQVFQAAITNLVAKTGDQASVTADQHELQVATSAHRNLVTVKNIARLKKIANEKRVAWLQQSVVADINTTAWCADLNENLTGEVGLLDVGRQQGTNIIKPGGAVGDQAGYVAATDGKYEPLASSTPAGAFYNLALLPGVEKWKPRYRTGTITGITGDLCDINLDAATSQQNININPTSTLADVAVVYMDCNGAAFDVGDHVIIEFVGQDWNAPQVVGFVDNPKSCEVDGFICYPQGITAGRHLVKYAAGAWLDVGASPSAGSQHWVGSDPALRISWIGPRQRYHIAGQLNVGAKFTACARHAVPGENNYFVFLNRVKHDDGTTAPSTGGSLSIVEANLYFGPQLYQHGTLLGNAPDKVMGAAVLADGRIVVACGTGTTTTFYVGSPASWAMIGTVALPIDFVTWKFSPDGLKAVAVTSAAQFGWAPAESLLIEATINPDLPSVTASTSPSETAATGDIWAIMAADYDPAGNVVTLEYHATSASTHSLVNGDVSSTETTTSTSTVVIAFNGADIIALSQNSFDTSTTDIDLPKAWTSSSNETYEGFAIHDLDLRFGGIVYGLNFYTDSRTASGDTSASTFSKTISRHGEFHILFPGGGAYSETGQVYSQSFSSTIDERINTCGGLPDAAGAVTRDRDIECRIVCDENNHAIVGVAGPISNPDVTDPLPVFFYAASSPAGVSLVQNQTILPIAMT